MLLKRLRRFNNTVKANKVSSRTDQTSVSECDKCEFSMVKQSFTIDY